MRPSAPRRKPPPTKRISRYRRHRSKIVLGWALLVGGAAALASVYLAGGPTRDPPDPEVRTASPKQATAAPSRQAVPARPLAEIARAAGIECAPIANARLVVDKSDLELRFFSGETLLKTYPVARGFGDLGDKERRDDGRTPEGDFYVVDRNMTDDPRRWGDVFMLLNYPQPEDADRGLAAGLIDEEEHGEIHAAAERRETPPQDTALGSGIGIHIGGIRPTNWTEGCVALEREDGIEVYRQTRVGTPVAIRR
jgi:hypothetical protein